MVDGCRGEAKVERDPMAWGDTSECIDGMYIPCHMRTLMVKSFSIDLT